MSWQKLLREKWEEKKKKEKTEDKRKKETGPVSKTILNARGKNKH